jgi:hypothetical protein
MNPYNKTPIKLFLSEKQIAFCAKKVLHLKLDNVTEYIRYLIQKDLDNFDFITVDKYKDSHQKEK